MAPPFRWVQEVVASRKTEEKTNCPLVSTGELLYTAERQWSRRSSHARRLCWQWFPCTKDGPSSPTSWRTPSPTCRGACRCGFGSLDDVVQIRRGTNGRCRGRARSSKSMWRHTGRGYGGAAVPFPFPRPNRVLGAWARCASRPRTAPLIRRGGASSGPCPWFLTSASVQALRSTSNARHRKLTPG